jgi:three-Cys-motif partner protein
MTRKGDADGTERYEEDDDGYRREIVGPWARDKHLRLEKYIGIARAVRKKFVGSGKAGTTYLELFAGPGRVRIRDEHSAIDGSPLIAWKSASKFDSPFTQVHVADADSENVAAVRERLKRLGAPVQAEVGPAIETVARIVAKLSPDALHFAFLDPYKLGDLSFDIIRQLAALKRMDILMHVSVLDLQRNLRLYIQQERSPLDSFAPVGANSLTVTAKTT